MPINVYNKTELNKRHFSLKKLKTQPYKERITVSRFYSDEQLAPLGTKFVLNT